MEHRSEENGEVEYKNGREVPVVFTTPWMVFTNFIIFISILIHQSHISQVGER